MNSLLEIKNLKIRFENKDLITYAVNDISFSIKLGESVGIVGESGSGKSVTSKSILKLLGKNAKISGSILFNGEELLDKNDNFMKTIRSVIYNRNTNETPNQKTS